MFRGIRDLVPRSSARSGSSAAPAHIARPGALVPDRARRPPAAAERGRRASRPAVGRVRRAADADHVRARGARRRSMEGRGAFATWRGRAAGCRSACCGTRPASPPRRCPPGSRTTGLPLAVQLVGAPHGEAHAAGARGPDRGRPLVATSPPTRLRLLACRRRMAVCRICSGELELRVRGNGAALTAAALSPSAHEPGAPRRPARLPRVRHRPAARAAVRRAAARPLPRDARRRVPGRGGGPPRDREPPARPDRRARAARAGCSTSAAATACCSTRRAGAATRRVGLELSRDAARHARDALGLDVRELPLEAFGAGRNGDSPGEFDVVVLADVLEHLDDPVAAIDRCARLLRPGGVLCIVTPDPSSLTARAGRRALVGLPARPHRAAPAPHAARADLGARARDLRRRPVRAHVRRAPLGRRARGAARAARAGR